MRIKVGDLVKPKERKSPWLDLAGAVIAIFEKPVVVVKLGDKHYPFFENELTLLKAMTNEEAEKFIVEKGLDKKADEFL